MSAELPIVVVTGTPFERGVAHGSRFGREIATIVQRDLYSLPGDDLSKALGRATVAFEAIRELSPEVADEIAGIAEGAGRAVPEIVLRSGFELLTPLSDTGCSALAAKTNLGAIAAQNWDGLPSKHSDLALFLHFSPSGFQFAIVASFGALGFAGMNNRGLALVNNDLILKGSRDGVPSQVVRRIVLAMPDVKSAAERISSLPHMGGRSYLLADRAGEIAAVEVSSRSGANFFAPRKIHLHTNNALLPVTRAEEDTKALRGMYPSSAARLYALRTAAERVELSVDGVKQVLRDESGAPDAVCKTASANELTETAFSIVMDCSRGELHLASGRPSINSYQNIALPFG